MGPLRNSVCLDAVHSPEDTAKKKKGNKSKSKKKGGGGSGDNQPNQNADEAEGASTEAADESTPSPVIARAAGDSVSSLDTEASFTEADASSPEDRPMTQLRWPAC